MESKGRIAPLREECRARRLREGVWSEREPGREAQRPAEPRGKPAGATGREAAAARQTGPIRPGAEKDVRCGDAEEREALRPEVRRSRSEEKGRVAGG